MLRVHSFILHSSDAEVEDDDNDNQIIKQSHYTSGLALIMAQI